MRLIDAGRMKVDLLTVDPRYETMAYWCLTVLDAQPTIEPQRIKSIWADGRCLRCGEHAPFHPMASAYYESNFCPNCGADMRGEQE